MWTIGSMPAFCRRISAVLAAWPLLDVLITRSYQTKSYFENAAVYDIIIITRNTNFADYSEGEMGIFWQ